MGTPTSVRAVIHRKRVPTEESLGLSAIAAIRGLAVDLTPTASPNSQIPLGI